ncbi:MAG: tyrosine-type recombinase/integrase [Myxococcales bacterium]|nr:tyrosine-type recombinase/integrase [Myxococcales bacterium]
MTLDAAIAAFTAQMAADGRSPHTVAAYGRALRLFRGWAGDRPVATLTPPTLAAFLASDTARLGADGRPRQATSVNLLRSALRAFGQHLVACGIVEHSPTRALRNARSNTPPPAILDDLEVARLLATLSDAATTDALARRDHVLFALLLGTGLRVGSVVGIDTADVDLAGRRVAIVGKGNRRDTVLLNARLHALLTAHLATLDGPGPLFRSRTGQRLDARNVQLRFARWLAAAGIAKPITVHGLRHTFGTRLYRATRDLRLVQRALHHRHVTSTQLYVHLADDELAAALEAV